MSGPIYRARQFLAALRARPLEPADLELVRQYLPAPAFELFLTMPLGDQHHSLTILRSLLAEGYRDRPLLQAALLHDVAKARLGLPARTVVVLLNAVSPRLLPRLASSNPHSWRYPLYLSWRHAEFGAEAAEQAGLDPRAVLLIRQHQVVPAEPGDGEIGRWQRALQVLDDRN